MTNKLGESLVSLQPLEPEEITQAVTVMHRPSFNEDNNK